MKIPTAKLNSSLSLLSCTHSTVEVPNQEYIFAGILKRGPEVSRLDTDLSVYIYDMEDSSGLSMIFSMSVLEASKVSFKEPSFEDEGLAGWWKILRDDSDRAGPPRIVLQETVSVDSKEKLSQFLLHNNSAHFVRQR